MIYILVLLSIMSYLLAPSIYSYTSCMVSTILFLSFFLIIFKYDKREKVGFNLLFSLAFFSCNYIYPLFVYPIFPTFSLFAYEINYDVISKATALATLAYSLYALGYWNYLKTHYRVPQENYDCINILSSGQLRITGIVFLMLYLLFVISGGLVMFTDAYEQNDSGASGIANFTYLVFYTFSIFAVIMNIDLKNKFILILTFISIVSLMATGSRTLPILLVSIVFCRYCFKREISIKKMILFLICGFVLFSIVGRFRGGQEGKMYDEEIGYISTAEDFLINSRTLYDIYDHVDKDGINYGRSSLGYILAVIPFSQSLVMSVFNIPAYEMRSETLTSYWTLGKDSTLGFGTNIVGDVYLSFGLIGVMLLFYLLGKIVILSRIKGYNGNPYYMIVYYVLVSGAVFMCRGSYFYSLKNVVWLLAFSVFFSRIKIKQQIV